MPHELAALTGTGRKRVAVVLNPSKIADVEDFKDRVRQVAQRDGWNEPLWFETTIEDPGHGQALAALQTDVDLIIAAGGDGTVRAVCEEVARTGVAVGILPHGTGNLLARNLRIPLNTRDALDVAFSGQDKAIDLSTLKTDSGTDTWFLVMAGLGMDAAIMTGVDDKLKAKVGWLAYFVSGVKAARYPAMKVQISVDDGEFRKFRARTVVVGNVGFLQGGIPLLPDAQIDDGHSTSWCSLRSGSSAGWRSSCGSSADRSVRTSGSTGSPATRSSSVPRSRCRCSSTATRLARARRSPLKYSPACSSYACQSPLRRTRSSESGLPARARRPRRGATDRDRG